MDGKQKEIYITASSVIHVILVAIAAKGICKVVDEIKEVNKLRTWDGIQCPVTALQAYESTLVGVAYVNKSWTMLIEEREKENGGV